MRGGFKNIIIAVFITCIFIGTSIVPAFSSDLSIITTVRESILSDTTDYSDESKENNGRNLFQRIGQRLKDSTNAFFPSRFQEYREQLQDTHFPHPLHRSQPVIIDGVDGEWDIVVPDEYDSIQEAIDDVGPQNGYQIFVRSGTYHENIVINTDGVILHGENKETTIINGNNEGHVVTLESSYNNISGFTIQNSGTDHAGIFLDVSSGNQVFDNNILDNGNGMYLSRSHANNITENIIADNSQHGIHIDSSSLANTISANQVQNNDECGILIDNASRSNLIAGNKVESNRLGVKITGVSENNMVHHNIFIGNDQNAFDDHDNYWDDQLGDGNYWGDYTGTDADGDGIGDTPYEIPGGVNFDYYPLMNTPAMNYFSFQIKEMQSDNSSNFSKTDFSFSGYTIIVPDDYPTIQSAVDHAVDGDRIEVRPGNYYENVLVNKSVEIIGSNPNNTLVDGQQVNHVFKIVADNVMVSRLRLQNTTMGYAGFKILGDNVEITGNTIRDCGDGINIGGLYFLIKDNIISSCNFGIYYDSTEFGITKNNMILDNNDGIDIWSSANLDFYTNSIKNNNYIGILHLWSVEDDFKFNIISDNLLMGFQLFSSNHNEIINTSIPNNGNQGISLKNSKNNQISNNTITKNDFSGIYQVFFSNNNLISNNFLDENGYYNIFIAELSNDNIIESNMIINANIGIYIKNNRDNQIRDNSITENIIGIETYHTNHLIIQNNTISNNKDTGIFDTGNDTKISWNIVSKNSFYGIVANNDNTLILNNFLNKNRIGLYLDYCEKSLIKRNNISDNTICGLFLDAATSFFNDVKITENNFITNNIQSLFLSAYPTFFGLKLDSINKIFENNELLHFVLSRIINLVIVLTLMKVFNVNNFWDNNYWSNWDLKIPKPIYGNFPNTLLNVLSPFYHYWYIPGISSLFSVFMDFLILSQIPRKNIYLIGLFSYDFHPASEPYDFGG